jgi:hypothetical protein
VYFRTVKSTFFSYKIANHIDDFFIVSRKYSYLNIYLQLNIEILIIIWKKGTLNLKLRFLLLKKDKESQNNNNDLSNFVKTSLQYWLKLKT